MSTGHILLLGAIAGATIFLGLPVARMHGLRPNARSGLSALATGILVFLFWDVITNAVDPIEASLEAHHWGKFAELSALGAAGFIAGLMSLVYYDAWMKSRADRRSTTLIGPGAAAVDELRTGIGRYADFDYAVHPRQQHGIARFVHAEFRSDEGKREKQGFC